MQVADLQKAASATQHLALAGYQGDHNAQKSGADTQLDYEVMNVINMCVDEHVCAMAFQENVVDQGRKDSDPCLVSLYKVIRPDPPAPVAFSSDLPMSQETYAKIFGVSMVDYNKNHN